MTTAPHSDLATKQERLAGDELLAFINGNASMSKTEMCLGAGYIKDTDKPAFTDFYEAILEARNIPTTNDGLIDLGGADWYESLTDQDRELYDMIEDRCPEFEKLAAEQCQEFMDELSEHGITTAGQFEDALYYQTDSYDAVSEFAEHITTECNCVDLPSYVVIDWEATWHRNLSYEFSFIEFDGSTYFFSDNF